MATINEIIKQKNKNKFYKKNITQEKFIEDLSIFFNEDLEISKLRRYLNGYLGNFTLKTLNKMGDIFEISYESYFNFEGFPYEKRELCRCFAKNLNMYRKFKKMSQKDFAKEIDISYCSYKSYEGNYGNPKINTLIKIANKLNISVISLIK